MVLKEAAKAYCVKVLFAAVDYFMLGHQVDPILDVYRIMTAIGHSSRCEMIIL